MLYPSQGLPLVRSGRLLGQPMGSRSIRSMVAERREAVGRADLHPHIFHVIGYNAAKLDGQLKLGHT